LPCGKVRQAHPSRRGKVRPSRRGPGKAMNLGLLSKKF